MTGNTDLRETDASVVVLGNFNPLIFQPEWLAANDIVGPENARNAEIELIHPQLVVLNFSALRLEVQQDRFLIKASEAPTIIARDFALKCFKLLSHTPVIQLGLNFGTVFRPRTRESWDAFGDALAPKEPWEVLLGDMSKGRAGGLTNMRVEKWPRGDNYTGQQSLQISIADRATMDTKLDFNDHYELVGDTAATKMMLLVEILENRWDASEQEATAIANSLRGLCRAH